MPKGGSTVSRVIRSVSLCVVLAVLVLLGASGALAQQAAPAPAAGRAPAAAPAAAPASPAPRVDTGDTAWVLTSSALVLMMTAPGLALFYGGMVRRKNVLATLMQSFILMAVISVQWVLFGYSLAFGPDIGGIVGSLKWIGLSGVGVEPNADYAATIPHQAFMVFQLMFAIITPALITGTFAERMKFSAFLLFSLLWATFIYDPLAHWVWGVGGWIRGLGALDFAGGTVVHISSGVSALAAAIVIGRRKGYGREPMPPHNLPFTVIGSAMLWVGWFGFNAGSELASDGLASSAFCVTHFAAAAGTLAWAGMEWITRGKPSVLGAASGAVAGLVCITPASGFVQPMPAFVMGIAVGIVCFLACTKLKAMFGYDDSLDAFGVHGIGGTLGAILTGVFATRHVADPVLVSGGGNPVGLVDGNSSLLIGQLVAVVVTWVLAAVATFIILKVLDVTMGLRVSRDEEQQGLDLSQHGEEGYIFI
jgi:Amt family ammonium transporter